MISVILPIAQNESKEKIKHCLDSLAFQTYKDFEVIIVTFPNTSKVLSPLLKKYSFVKILTGSWKKAAARNIGAKKAKGEYIYHLDADMAPTPQVLSECIKKAEEGAEAIIIPDEEAPRAHFISKCRALERRILYGSGVAITPLFFKRSFFEKVGGYDENLDPMDDWNLHLTLRKVGVKSESIQAPVLVKETTSFKRALKRKYEMGRIYPALKAKHPHPPQLNPKLRFEDYFRNWRELAKSPLVSLGLFVLKAGDILSFFWGALHPIAPKNRYTLTKVAKEYDQKRLGNNFGRYKHFAELRSLFRLLPQRDLKILEVGCGTGRITEQLIEKGYKVSPIDSSRAMLAQYQQKAGLPKPQLTDATQLPFPDGSFPTVFSLRVIWHFGNKEDREKMFSEATRVSSNSIILDITNRKRWPKIYRDRYPNEYFFTWEEFVDLCKEFSLKIEEGIPLDTVAPFWLNFFPSKLAPALFPIVYRVDLLLAKLIPPGRYLVKLSKL